jgi:hypothetical protein
MCGCRGKASFAEALKCGAKQGKTFAYQVLPDLQGKGPVRQRSLSADLIFGSLYQDKEQSLSGKRHQAINKRYAILNHPISPQSSLRGTKQSISQTFKEINAFRQE